MNTTFRPTKMFTVEQANAMLPLVKAIATDASLLASEILERRERISELKAGRTRASHDTYAEELSQIEEELDRQSDRLHEYAEELRQLGTEPKGVNEGLVDFPTRIEGEPAYLCWKLGEPKVLHWHPLEEGYAGRRLLSSLTEQRSSLFDTGLNN